MDYVALTPRQLGQILKRCRTQRGQTQLEAGSKVGLKQSTVSSMEANVARTRVESLYKLLSSLGVELILRDKSANPATQAGKREW
jgi:HTH-type transcriptional regulator/antitoxin HipB